MIVDFHTHVFPDELAPRAMKQLSDEIDGLYPTYGDGTVSGLLKNMDNWGIDISVVAPVVTNHKQMRKVNEWTATVQTDRLVCFGGIYPHTDDYKRDIDFVVSLGLRGLKFHAEYQDFELDADYMLKIYDYALSKNLILLHHAGLDPAYQPPYRSSPQQFKRVEEALRIAEKMRSEHAANTGIIVAAHLGGQSQWDDVEKYLAGSEIYFDTSMGFDFFPHDQFLRIVKKHGADKILFASDAPWSNAKTEIEHIKSMTLSKSDIDLILGGNAMKILSPL